VIRALRKKFIAINMLLIFLVLLIVFSAVCVSGYKREAEESRMTLQTLADRRDGQQPRPFYVGQRLPADFAPAPAFVLRVNEDGVPRLLFAENISVTEDSLRSIARELADATKNEGVLKPYNLRYLKRPEYGGFKVALIDMSEERAAVRHTVLISALSLLASLSAFFVVSFFLSGWVFKPAERAWQQQRRFVADASHELKTPLTVILANAGILKNSCGAPARELLRWIDNTEAEGQRMKKLVDDLLFLAKSDGAGPPAVHARIRFGDLVQSAALSFESLAFARGIRIDASRVEGGVCVNGDAFLLYRLVSVLLDNAVKYSDDGGTVSLFLDVRRSKAVLSVHNNGLSVAAEDLAHLFERFYRADRARAGEGYGLGLAIAESIAEQHCGRIVAESDDARGTVFTVFLPACREAGA
jgi:signal transduction histidine kinase